MINLNGHPHGITGVPLKSISFKVRVEQINQKSRFDLPMARPSLKLWMPSPIMTIQATDDMFLGIGP